MAGCSLASILETVKHLYRPVEMKFMYIGHKTKSTNIVEKIKSLFVCFGLVIFFRVIRHEGWNRVGVEVFNYGHGCFVFDDFHWYRRDLATFYKVIRRLVVLQSHTSVTFHQREKPRTHAATISTAVLRLLFCIEDLCHTLLAGSVHTFIVAHHIGPGLILATDVARHALVVMGRQIATGCDNVRHQRLV